MRLSLKELQAMETEIVKEVSEICRQYGIDYYLHCGSALGAVRHGGPIPWDSDVDIIIPINQFDKFLQTVRRNLPDKFYIDYYDTNKQYPTFFPRIGLKGFSTHQLHVDIFKLTGISSDKKYQKKFTKRAKIYLQVFRMKTKLREYYGNNISTKMRIGALLLKPVLFFIPRNHIIRLYEKLCYKLPFERAEFVTNLSGGYGMKNIQKKNIYGKGASYTYSGFEVQVPERYHDYLKHYYGDYMQLPHINQRETQNLYELKKL